MAYGLSLPVRPICRSGSRRRARVYNVRLHQYAGLHEALPFRGVEELDILSDAHLRVPLLIVAGFMAIRPTSVLTGCRKLHRETVQLSGVHVQRIVRWFD